MDFLLVELHINKKSACFFSPIYDSVNIILSKTHLKNLFLKKSSLKFLLAIKIFYDPDYEPQP